MIMNYMITNHLPKSPKIKMSLSLNFLSYKIKG